MAINRTIPPPTIQVGQPEIPFYDTIVLKNGLPIHSVADTAVDAVKVSIYFNAGLKNNTKPFLASTTASVWQQGTQNLSGLAFSSAIDGYGAYLNLSPGYEFTEITVHTLGKYFVPVMDLVLEMIEKPALRESDVLVDTQNRRQRLVTENKKTGFTAMANFNSLCYGAQHPMGRLTHPDEALEVSHSDVLGFYQQYFANGLFSVIVAGNITPEMTRWMEEKLGSKALDFSIPVPGVPVSPQEQNYHFTLHETANQSSLVMGKPLFSRLHPDFPKMRLLTTVFGGYFSSRLMSNIREDKGYTYGISAILNANLNSGQLVIRTDVGTEVSAGAVQEIKYELQRLTEELIPEEELELVRNYMQGTFLRSMDGALSQAEVWGRLLNYGLGPESLQANLDAVRNTTPEELLALAKKYFQPDSMKLVISGSVDISRI